MTLATPARDLVDQAGRRARLAALLGALLLEEPGPALAALVRGVPALAPLAGEGPEVAVHYERLLLRDVPPYESVFLSDDGQLGGEAARAVAGAYTRHGFDEDGRWRVAGADHLGLQLRFYAQLCAEELAGWEEDRPDRAVAAIEAERSFLADHLGRWGPVAADVLVSAAGAGPYEALAEALADFLAEEAERLRPAPDHPELPALEPRVPPARLGPARLARWLLAPGSSGVWLDAGTLAEAALRLGIPWRASDPRSQFRKVIEEATDGGDLAALLASLRPTVEQWRDRHVAREASNPGAARIWRAWRLQAEETLALIDRIAARSREDGAGAGRPVVVTVGDAGAAQLAVERVSRLGLRTALSAELPPELTDYLGTLLAAGADELAVHGTRLTATAWVDGGTPEAREARLLPDVEVVVRIVPGSGPTTVTANGGAAARVRASLGLT